MLNSQSFLCILVFSALFMGVHSTVGAQKTVKETWNEEWKTLSDQIENGTTADIPAEETLNPEALIDGSDRDPLDVLQRRTEALMASQRRLAKTSSAKLSKATAAFAEVQSIAQTTSVTDTDSRQAAFAKIMAANRIAMLSNPVFDFDTVVAMLETFIECRIVECARPYAHATGGGPIMITGLQSGSPRHVKLLDGIKVTSGPWAGKELTGKFSGLELDWEGTCIYFAATTNDGFWHIFRFNLQTKDLDQLTNEKYDDFDPCVLPSGRIVFTSTRRGGIGRCLLTTESLTFTLHTMAADGSDIVPISFHETNDWQPSVDNSGMIVYNRWDYFDRHWGTAHHLFLTFPDGRDPRNYHGNYPLPHDVMKGVTSPREYGTAGNFPNGRALREDVDMTLRAVPGTKHKYTATAVGHHEGFSGTLIMIDISIPDDGKMSQVKRITPDVRFPEVEGGSHTYGTCWPLDETTFMANYKSGLYLIDDKGNRQVLYDPGNLGRFRIRDPFPLRSRTKPPEIPVQTFQGERENDPDHKPATIGVVNCYVTDSIPCPIPEGTKIKWMRISQIIPQLLTRISKTTIGYMSKFDESTGRIPLGIVPVEDDGSVYCEAPANKALYYQLLDSNGIAVHSMRSVSYTHSGEQLVCTGCHESRWEAPPTTGIPKAFQRPPSKLQPEVVDGAIPFNFHRLVEWPVFQTKCLPCHQKEKKGLTDMSYRSVAQYRLAFGFQGEQGFNWKGTGGSRTTPGKFGTYASGIWQALTTKPAMKGVIDSLSKDELKRLTLWLEMNSNRLCWESDDPASLDAQRRGDVSWPPIDIVPYNPTGVEYLDTDDDAPSRVPDVQMITRTFPVDHMLVRWKPATDSGSGVGAYKIYRNDKFLCMVPDYRYIDRSVDINKSYTYEISAVDRTGNEGPRSKGIPTQIEENSPPIFINPVVAEKYFRVQGIARSHSIAVTIQVPENTETHATVSLFSLDGRLYGRRIVKRNKTGLYTADFPKRGFSGVLLCNVKVGKYNEMVRILNVEK